MEHIDPFAPTFVATYERPELAKQVTMPCGHTAAVYDSSGRCMRCAVESSAQQHFTDAYRRSILEHVGE